MIARSLVAVAWVGCLHLAAWAVGRALLARLDARGDGAGARGAFFAQILGLAALSVVAIGLGFTRRLHAPLLAGAILVSALFGLVSLARSLRGVRFRVGLADSPLIVAALFVVWYVPLALLPVLAHDDNVYHLLLPKLYLQHHALIPRPHLLFANMPHLIETLYVFPMAIGDFTAAKLWNLSLNGWILVGVAGFGGRVAGRLGAGIAALLYVMGSNVQWHFGHGYVEPVIGLFLLGAALAAVNWLEHGDERWLTIAGVACGMACASKYSAWLFAAAIVAPLLVVAARRGAVVGAAVKLAGIPALFVLPWLVKNQVLTGNPIYPNLHRLLGGRFWTDVQQMQYLKSLSVAGGLDKGWQDYLLLPFRLPFREEFFFTPPFSIALMALMIAALLLPTSYRRSRAFLPIAMLAAFLGWAFTVQHARYLVAAVPLFTLAATLSLIPIRRNTAALAIVALAIAATGWYQLQGRLPGLSVARDLVSKPREALLARNANWALCRYLNESGDGRVLAMWDNRFYFLDRAFQSDSIYEGPTGLAWLRRADDPAAFAAEISDSGFTQVVINMAPLTDYAENRFPMSLLDERVYPAERYARDLMLLDRFMIEWLEPEHREGSSVVFRIRAAPD